jgi:hypothetical protein
VEYRDWVWEDGEEGWKDFKLEKRWWEKEGMETYRLPLINLSVG